MSLQPLTEGPWFRPWVVSQEGDDGREAAEVRRAVAQFPVCDGRGVHADLPGCFPLQEPEVKPALPQMVAKGVKLRGIGGRKRFLSSQVDTATRQRRDEGRWLFRSIMAEGRICDALPSENRGYETPIIPQRSQRMVRFFVVTDDAFCSTSLTIVFLSVFAG
jgi:hypothetical protein